MPSALTFESALPRLVTAHDQGVLVPFLGAGMSRDTCPDWKTLVTSLEAQSGVPVAGGALDEPADLVRRANRAVRVLKRREQGAGFPGALRHALYAGCPPSELPIPAQTAALARIWWPLVMSTNYDDLFATVYEKGLGSAPETLAVVGRSAQDCQQVLSSLSSTMTGSLLWALQGYLPRNEVAALRPLEDELVVGHEEYRRVTHTALHFRRAFGEVFRRRSLLFLGSSLSEAYLLDLFGEVLEFSGANPLPHYAMVREGSVDTDFLRSRFNIIALEFGGYPELPGWLDRLGEAIGASRARPVRWSFQLAAPPRGGGASATTPAPAADDLEIVRGPLPLPAPGECVAVSAGLGSDGSPWFNPDIYDRLVRPTWPRRVKGEGSRASRLGTRFLYGPPPAPGAEVWPVVAVMARDADSDRRDLRLIGEAATELFQWAAAQGFQRLRMQLLASGKTSHFPSRFSLAETVRAFGRWKRESGSPLPLVIHLVNPGALFEVSTGRLDVVELLTCDDLRFWVEVVDGVRVLERELMFEPVERTVGALAARFDVRGGGWSVEVNPRPQSSSGPVPVLGAASSDLLDIGVISGATLRFVAG